MCSHFITFGSIVAFAAIVVHAQEDDSVGFARLQQRAATVGCRSLLRCCPPVQSCLVFPMLVSVAFDLGKRGAQHHSFFTRSVLLIASLNFPLSASCTHSSLSWPLRAQCSRRFASRTSSSITSSIRTYLIDNHRFRYLVLICILFGPDSAPNSWSGSYASRYWSALSVE